MLYKALQLALQYNQNLADGHNTVPLFNDQLIYYVTVSNVLSSSNST